MLMEKAYAKAFGSYESIEGGLTGMAIRDISGAPYEFLKVDDAKVVWEFLWNHKLICNYN